MTVINLVIRRPPRCRTCNRTGFERGRVNTFDALVVCRQCHGRSAKVEYYVEYGPRWQRKAVWDNEESGVYAEQ